MLRSLSKYHVGKDRSEGKYKFRTAVFKLGAGDLGLGLCFTGKVRMFKEWCSCSEEGKMGWKTAGSSSMAILMSDCVKHLDWRSSPKVEHLDLSPTISGAALVRST